MAYCGPKALPLSVFLSWMPSDQDAALQWQARESRRCHGCGTHPDEWNPEVGGSRRAYVAKLVVCPGCAARDGLAKSPEGSEADPGVRVELHHNHN